MLYKETPDGFVLWTGEPIDGVRHPMNIEDLWTPQELADVGLYVPVETAVPEGKIAVSTGVYRVNGVVQYVHTLEDAPPPNPADYPLSDRQLRLGLILAGFNLATIQAAIDAIPDAMQRAIAQVWWDRSIQTHWEHPMTQTLIGLVGLTQQQAAAMWLSAKDIEA